MNVTWLHPAPHCPVPLTHPARAYTNSNVLPDVRKTMQPYMIKEKKNEPATANQ